MIFNNQKAHIFKKQFLMHMILLKMIFGSKKIDNYTSFLVSCFLTSPFNGLFTSSSNIFAII
jgi:hypothetical protein